MTILTEIAAQLPDNNAEQITPAILRGVLNDMVADYAAVAAATAAADVSGLAPLASPALTGTPTAPTPTVGDNSTKLSTTAFVATAVANLVNGSPAALDTLKELADALGDDANFATTVTNALALKAPLASPALTGTPTAPTAAANTSTTQLATTAFVAGQAGTATPVVDGAAAIGVSLLYARQDHVHPTDTSRAPLASPTFTGSPAAPTPTARSNSTLLATAAYVDGATREKLTGNRTYFVLTTGSDSNTGLVNTAGGAFLTIQKAINVAQTIDLNGFGVTIQVGAGTYAAGFSLSSPFVGGNVTVTGDTTTPANVIITNAGVINVFEASGFGMAVSVGGFKISSGGSGGIGVYAHDGAALTITGKMEFGVFSGGAHIQAARLGYVNISNGVAYTISGNANYHLNASGAARINTNQATVTISGSLTFSVAFAQANAGSWIGSISNTYTGTVTATLRYNITGNSVIDTAGSGASYFPGTSAGTTSTGGQYL